jgi:Glycosyl hydrolase family 71
VVAGPLTATNSGDACLPITMPATDTVFNSSKRIFAHYFDPFPLSIDNKAPNGDYYNTEYLNKNGESNKWVHEGGYLRQRPLGVNASANPNWKQLNMQHEVTSAIARGITGFTFDVMGLEEVTDPNSNLHLMLKAAQAVDSRFKIIVMPDMTVFGSNADAVVQIIASVANSPAAYKLSDGRLVASAFDAGLDSAAWWEGVLSRLKAKGVNVAFVPTFLGWNLVADLFASITYGFADWGTATAGGSALFLGDPAIVHDLFKEIFMTPVGSQQYRPKDFVYWEAGNSASLRAGWTSSINGDADWVQVVTWNDYSESGQVSPYTDITLQRTIGTGYYDLSGYYAAWYLTGKVPAITHDVLYYFYRREPTTAKAPAQSQPDYAVGGAAENDIEVLGFLTAPGQLKITIGGKTYTHDATAAGMVSFKVPSQAGVPLFALSRNGADVFSFEGGVQIYGEGGLPSGVADMTYWSGSAAKSGICSL